jgi:hypothetical protein
MNRYIYVLLLTVIIGIFSCTTMTNNKVLSKALDIPLMPKPTSTYKTGIVISIDLDYRTDLKMHSGKFDLGGKLKVNKVFFIKLDNVNDSLKKDKIMVSNYYHAPFMAGFQMAAINTFLLDIEPGFYAAVGAQVDKEYIYFPEEVIKESFVEVKPNRIVYMGEYKLQVSIYKTDDTSPDKLQYYYYSNLLLGDHKDTIKGKVVGPWGHNPIFHAPKVGEILKSRDLEIKFLKSYIGHFKKSGWIESIQNRINDLKS